MASTVCLPDCNYLPLFTPASVPPQVDAIGGSRFDGDGTEGEVQRTMLEIVNQLDGFEPRGNIKVLMATNRPDTLDPALLRPGRLDRKVEFGLPDLQVRHDIARSRDPSFVGLRTLDLFACPSVSLPAGRVVQRDALFACCYCVRVKRLCLLPSCAHLFTNLHRCCYSVSLRAGPRAHFQDPRQDDGG